MTKQTQAAPEAVWASARKRRPGRAPANRGHGLAAAILLAPALIGFLVFWIYPAIVGFGYSLTDFNLLKKNTKFVGTAQFEKMLGDSQVWESFKITILYAILSMVISLALALLLAAMMQRLRLGTWVRSLLLLPWLVPNVAIALIWAWLLDANVGYLKNILDDIGSLPGLGFLQNFTFYNSDAALPIIILMGTWAGLGYTALLLYAGMMQVPNEYYEAAAIDGASETQMFFRITMPLIRPVLALVVILSLIGAFQVFDLVQVGYGNNPIPEVRVIYYYIYQQAILNNKMAYGSAIALVLAVILGILTVVQLRLMRANRSDLA